MVTSERNTIWKIHKWCGKHSTIFHFLKALLIAICLWLWLLRLGETKTLFFYEIMIASASAFRIKARHFLVPCSRLSGNYKNCSKKMVHFKFQSALWPIQWTWNYVNFKKCNHEEQLILIPEGISKPFTHCIFATCYKLLDCFL